MAKATSDDTQKVKSVMEVFEQQEINRADEAKAALDARIDALLVTYNAVVTKVPGEHAQAAIFAALVNNS